MCPLLLLLVGLLTFFPIVAFAVPVPFITLDASMEQPVCLEGQPAVLALALYNSSTERYIIDGSAFEEASFQISVTDQKGHTVPRTAVGERVLTPPMAVDANSTVALSPGQTILYRFNLARLFDLSRTGTYTINVSRRLRPQVWPMTVPSAIETLPQVFALTAHPLTVRMTEDATSISGSTAYAPPPSRQAFLYAVGPNADGICHYLIGQDGSVSFSMAYSRLGSLGVPKGTDSLAATPNGRFLYAGNGSTHTVSQFRIGDNGVLFSLSPATVPAHSIPGPLLIDPKGRFLYNLSGTVYAIGSDGRLTVTASMANNPPGKIQYSDKGNVVSSYFGALDSKGTFLYTTALTGGYHLAPNGIITAPPPPSKTSWPVGGNVNAVAVSPSGEFAFVGVSTTLSNAYFDQIAPMRVASNGAFSALPAVATPKGPPSEWPNQTRPDCIALSVDPSGRFLIVVNPQYLACDRIGIDGSLTPVGAMPTGGDFTSVFFGPGGKTLYALNRSLAPLMMFRLDDRLGLIIEDMNLPSGIMFTNSMASATAPTPLKQGPITDGLAVSASLPADVLPSSAPVVLTVILKNITKHPIRLGTTGTDISSFRLSVAGPQRQSPGVLQGDGEPLAASVPLLAAGHDLLDAPGPSTVPVILPPGGQRQYRFVLSRLADLTVAGNYTVQITRSLPRGTAVASPVVPFLLDGPFNGRVRDDKYSVQIL